MLRQPVVKFFSKLLNRAFITIALVLVQAVWLLEVFFRVTEYAVWVNALLMILSLAIALHLIRKDENAAYKIVWLALIGALPVLGGMLYLLWGNKRPSKRMRQRMDKIERLHRYDMVQAEGQLDALPPRQAALGRYLAGQGRCPAWQNTSALYFPSGEAMHARMLQDLARAKKFIFLEYFIIRPGAMWGPIAEILKRKAAQGVDVRLIYDDFGCLLTLPSNFLIEMEKNHIRCLPFNPVVPLLSLVMNHRDHRKICVIDGNIAYTGGVNLADEYINAEERFGHWKDTALRIEGAAVWNFTVMFLNFWNAFRFSDKDYDAFRPTVQAKTDGVVQPYGDSPLDEEPLAENVYCDILHQAKDYAYIFTPYLAIGEEMMDALKMAAKRGVDVRLVLPGIPDKKLVFRLTRSYYAPLILAGVRVYEYTPGFLHAKCYVSDDALAVVGSINMDYRSLYLHFECGVLLMGNSQVAAVRKDMLDTIAKSREVRLKDCRTSVPGRMLDDVLRLLSPLL